MFRGSWPWIQEVLSSPVVSDDGRGQHTREQPTELRQSVEKGPVVRLHIGALEENKRGGETVVVFYTYVFVTDFKKHFLDCSVKGLASRGQHFQIGERLIFLLMYKNRSDSHAAMTSFRVRVCALVIKGASQLSIIKSQPVFI